MFVIEQMVMELARSVPGCAPGLVREMPAQLAGKSPLHKGQTKETPGTSPGKECWEQGGFRREGGQQSAAKGFLEEATFELSVNTRPRQGEPHS